MILQPHFFLAKPRLIESAGSRSADVSSNQRQDEDGQIAPVYSISAGLDYPGIGPEHAYLYDSGRAEYVPVTDDEAVDAFEYLSRLEGIIPAIESAHAVAHARKIAPTMSKDDIIIICLSGRGDKDVAAMAKYRGVDLHE